MVTEFERGVEEAEARDFWKDFVDSLVMDAAKHSDSIIYSKEYKERFVKEWTKKLTEAMG
jgi:predicted nuclease of predicted toxin-antitoxin system